MNPQTLVNSGLQRFQKCVSLISIYKAYNNAAALLDAGRPLFYYRHGNREIFSLTADLQQSAGIRRQNGEGLKNLKGTDRKHTPPPAVFSPPEQSSIFIDGQGEAKSLQHMKRITGEQQRADFCEIQTATRHRGRHIYFIGRRRTIEQGTGISTNQTGHTMHRLFREI